jgi:hypothetical protein
MCALHNYLAHWDQAIPWCEKSIAGNPQVFQPYVMLAAANAWAGRDKEAANVAGASIGEGARATDLPTGLPGIAMAVSRARMPAASAMRWRRRAEREVRHVAAIDRNLAANPEHLLDPAEARKAGVGAHYCRPAWVTDSTAARRPSNSVSPRATI